MQGLGIFSIAAAGLVALTPAPASAYRGTPIGLTPIAEIAGSANIHRSSRDHWHNGRYYRGDRRWTRDRRWRNDRRWRWRTVCRTEWRNGYRDRVCRRVRYR